MGIIRLNKNVVNKKSGVALFILLVFCVVTLMHNEVVKPIINKSVTLQNKISDKQELFYLDLKQAMALEKITSLRNVSDLDTATSPPAVLVGNSFIDNLKLGDKNKGKSFWRSLIINRNVTASEKSRIFILGSVAKNSSLVAVWDTFVVYGQWYESQVKTMNDVKCCFKFFDGHWLQRPVYSYTDPKEFNNYMLGAKLNLFHITCRIPKFGEHVTEMSIVRDYDCSSLHVQYVKPSFAQMLPNNHITITTKLAYLTIDMETVYSFMETARYIGIDKVITYVHESLEVKFRPVLLYYASIGLLEYHALELADTEHVPRLPSLKVLDNQYMQDEWLVKKDALERSMGSTYFGIFDMDEFLIPAKNRSLKQMLSGLVNSYPNASHFFFTTLHFLTEYTSPNLTCGTECSMFERHLYLAPHLYNGIHEKMILLTSRVVTQTINNHYIESHPGYTRATCPTEEGYLSHYGSCKRKFTGLVCEDTKSWILNTTMASWSKRTISKNIRNAMNKVKLLFKT